MLNLDHLTTEQINFTSVNIDQLSILQAAKLMNDEDYLIAPAIASVLPQIASAIEHVIAALKSNGRLIYIGAGNSGRTGYQDALECQPTFNTPANQVIGLIAGGFSGFADGLEDSAEQGQIDLQAINLQANDIVIGLSASGRTPYVKGALQYASAIGSKTIAIACNLDSEIAPLADYAISVALGPEVIAGSTRLKAGTAQKIICNMISTLSMVALGKVYQNLMVDVQVNNQKLEHRAVNIVAQAADVSVADAAIALKAADNRPKTAILMLLCGLEKSQAQALEAQNHGSIHQALASVQSAN